MAMLFNVQYVSSQCLRRKQSGEIMNNLHIDAVSCQSLQRGARALRCYTRCTAPPCPPPTCQQQQTVIFDSFSTHFDLHFRS